MKSIINVNNLKQYEYKGFSKLYQETLEIQIMKEVLKMLKIITQLYNDYTKIYKLAQYRDETFTAYRLKKIFISGGGKLFIFH
ncbi:hypothetical protein U3516DRAFT_778790 [Neocallimastix sp. 'constans']